MSNRFYVHRFSKVIEELVIQYGLTVYISDEGLDPGFEPHEIDTLQSVADILKVKMNKKSSDGLTILHFKKN